MSGHPSHLDLLLFVENNPAVDRPTTTAHLAACAECEAIVVEFQQIIVLLRHGDVLGYFSVEDPDRAKLRETLLNEYDEVAAECSSAEAFLVDLRALPVETWDAYFVRHPEYRTHGMARRLFEEVEVELNRRPEYALLLVGVAERIGHSLPAIECHAVLGDVWKHRCSALRHLGRYEEALDAAERAETLYASLSNGGFDVAQAQYNRATVLFKMTRFAEALEILATSNRALRGYGDSLPLAKTIILEAGIRMDRGDVAGAQQRWLDVLPILQRLGDDVEQARVLANLAECNLRLGNHDQAMEDAQKAVLRYQMLRMEMEAIRSEWTIGMVHLARGECEDGMTVLESAAASFALLGMTADAAFVKLDVCETRLRREEWAEAEIIARDLVSLFVVAGVPLASVNALHFLREAIEHRQATVEMVRSIRQYVTPDDPSRPFDLPPDTVCN